MGALYFFVVLALFLGAESRILKVLVPEAPPIQYFDAHKNLQGFLKNALSTIQRAGQLEFSTVIDTDLKDYDRYNLTTTNATLVKCAERLITKGDVDYCLTIKSGEVIDGVKRRGDLFMTQDFLRLAPAVVFARNETMVQPRNATYFIHVFHSSVWSLILLYTLCAFGLLYALELTHPFGYKLHKKWGKSPGCMGLPDCAFYIFTVLLNKSHNETPKSTGGKVLGLFWYAFTLIILITYLVGTISLIFVDPLSRNMETEPRYWKVPDLSNPSISVDCVQGSITCQLELAHGASFGDRSRLLAGHLRRQSASLSTSKNEAMTKLLRNTTMVLLTDSLYAVYLTQRHPGKLSFATVEGPETSLAFLARNSKMALEMDHALQLAKETGALKMVLEAYAPDQYQSGSQSDGGGLESSIAAMLRQSTPIRMVNMEGPFIFGMFGAACVIVTAISEFLYRTFINKEYLKIKEECPAPESDRSLLTIDEKEPSSSIQQGSGVQKGNPLVMESTI